MKLGTSPYSIGKLLGRYETRRVILPPFQRSFSWEKGHVTTFWDDLVHFEKNYSASSKKATRFLGSIVLIESGDSILLLDGQQRLATATIVLAALRDFARSLDKLNQKEGADLARDIQRELIAKDDAVGWALTLGDLDEPFFQKAIKSDPPAFPSSNLKSHKLIKGAYDLITDRLKEIVRAKGYDDSVQYLKSLHNALANGLMMIGMSVGSEEDAFAIFESLNDRGLRLSVPDLVLNLLMRRAPDDTVRQLVRQQWNSMLRALGKRDVSRFLRHFWVSQYGDLKAEGLYKAIKSDLESSKLSSLVFAEQCSGECDNYVSLLDCNVELTKGGLSDLEGIVRYLQMSSAPPLLLSGYRSLTSGDFEKLLAAIIQIHVRYVVMANQNPIDIETTFFDTARVIRATATSGASSADILSKALQNLRVRNIEDSKVSEASTDTALERSEAVWLMAQLAISMQSDTGELGLNKTNLEHIYPRNAKVIDWPNREELEPVLWHIGNLTILGEKLNTKSQNKAFIEKRDNYYSKSHVAMTKQLLPIPSWSAAAIRQRAKELSKTIIVRWPAV